MHKKEMGVLNAQRPTTTEHHGNVERIAFSTSFGDIGMGTRQRRERAEAAGYRVWPSDWEASGGETGRSWVVTRPNGDNLPDYVGTERAGWRAAHADMVAASRG